MVISIIMMFMMMFSGMMVSDFFSGMKWVVVIVFRVIFMVMMFCRMVVLFSGMCSDFFVYFRMMNCNVVFVF